MPAAIVHLGIIAVLILACYFEIAEWLKTRRARSPQVRPPKQVMVKRPQ